jgi:hypothetical protein
MNKKPTRQPSIKVPPPPVKKKTEALLKPASSIFNIKTILFFIVLAISFILFLKNLYGLPELTNIFIKRQASWVMAVQSIIAALAYVLFGYFGFLFINQKKENKYTDIAMWAGLILIICLHWLAFNAGFEDVDDNASYMISSKSLVDKGAPYYLYLPDMPVDTEGALGLPIMLIPFYLIWGLNFKPMEILIFLTMIGSVAMCYLLFKKMVGRSFALIITVIFGTHPYIVAFSSIIMTEIPYLFWSLMAILLVLKYESTEKFNIWWMLAAVVAVFMTYLTRAVGIGLVIATVLYLLLRSNMWPYLKTKSFKFIKDLKFKKFFFISAALFVVVLLYQLWARSLGGVSQAEALAKMNISQLFKQNLNAAWQVFAQNIFAGGIIRWEVKQIEPVGLLWIVVSLVTLAGMVISLLKRQLVAIYTIFVALVLMIGNTASSPIVLSRYLIIFTPMFVYFLYTGIQWPLDKLIKKNNWGKVAGIVVLSMILSSSFIGNGYTIQKSHTGELYNPAYASFMYCAVWAKDNLPKDAIVASRKERIFYIFSGGLKGFKNFNNKDQNILNKINSESPENQEQQIIKYQQDKLKEFKDKKTKYIIIDTFSSSSINVIYKMIIEPNPDKFKLVKIIGDEKKGPCYIFEVI